MKIPEQDWHSPFLGWQIMPQRQKNDVHDCSVIVSKGK